MNHKHIVPLIVALLCIVLILIGVLLSLPAAAVQDSAEPKINF